MLSTLQFLSEPWHLKTLINKEYKETRSSLKKRLTEKGALCFKITQKEISDLFDKYCEEDDWLIEYCTEDYYGEYMSYNFEEYAEYEDFFYVNEYAAKDKIDRVLKEADNRFTEFMFNISQNIENAVAVNPKLTCDKIWELAKTDKALAESIGKWIWKGEIL